MTLLSASSAISGLQWWRKVATERKLDIFRVLGAADKKQADFYAKLTDEERKEYQPFLVARWLSGTSSPAQVCMLNEFVNPYAFSLTSHKQLLWQLQTICTTGKSQRYVWNKLPSKRETGRPNAVKAVREYFGYSVRDALDAMEILTRTQILDFAEQLGWQPEDIAKIRREIKASDDDTPKKSKKAVETADNLLEF
jgi:hypothetical protein